ncbi:hypothetical protein ANRL1_01402 [Anaerolineae bacterium]|nr:hypothetical protein ANRL1_01402 [Anaerolineae bacterium]
MIRAHLAALALRPADSEWLSPRTVAVLLALHLLGLGAFWQLLHQPIWFAPATLALLLLAPLLTWRSRGRLAIETLAPLFFLYAMLAVRYLAIRVVNAPVPYQDESTLANVRVLAFQVELAAMAAFAYVALAQIARLFSKRALVALCAVIAFVAVGWFAAETIGHRTRGVTGSDPYAYAQMAVDLATRGTPLHRFAIFPSVAALNVTWYPAVHVGYELPINFNGDAATVWPLGGSVWLAAMYRALGEEGLYLATPLAALASLMALALLASELFRDQSRVVRAAIIAISVALLATSWEQVDRSIVPLVDVQAQLFTMLAMWSALKGTRGNSKEIFGAFVGVMLAAAYWVRHTQVLLAPAIVIAVWRSSVPRREKIQFITVVALAAFVVALPDLWYHQQYFGGWLTPESKELALFSIANVLPSAAKLSERFWAGNEFGYLVLFLLYGAYRVAREDKPKYFVLVTWLVILVGFHLFYEAIRMRDLLPEFPPVILLIAYGIVALVRDLRTIERPSRFPKTWKVLATGIAIFFSLLLFLTRTQFTLMRVIQPAKVTFGYVTAAQRASFDQIAALTPRDAVIASTMNDGPIDLYVHRDTVRLGAWNIDERTRLIEAMTRVNRRVFLLDDGVESSAARRDLAVRYTLKQIAVLDAPLFGIVDDTPGALWEILP